MSAIAKDQLYDPLGVAGIVTVCTPEILFMQGVFVEGIVFLPRRSGGYSLAFDGQVPEIAIANYLGDHPERLVDGFTAAEKPEGCGWMNQSRIKSIVNHMGSVLVELEPAGANRPAACS